MNVIKFTFHVCIVKSLQCEAGLMYCVQHAVLETAVGRMGEGHMSGSKRWRTEEKRCFGSKRI